MPPPSLIAWTAPVSQQDGETPLHDAVPALDTGEAPPGIAIADTGDGTYLLTAADLARALARHPATTPLRQLLDPALALATVDDQAPFARLWEAFQGSAGRPLGVTDATGRVRGILTAEAFLRSASPEASAAGPAYSAMFTRNTAPKLLIDPESGRIVDANPAALSFYGLDAAQMRRQHIQAINQLSPEEVRAEWERARHEERRYFRFRHRLADGGIRHVEVYSGPVVLNGREYLHSIIHDVTDAVRYRDYLEQYRAIFEALPVGVFRTIAGDHGRFAEVNTALAAILEADSLDDLLAHSVSDFYQDSDERGIFSDHLLARGTVHEHEVGLVTLTGRPIRAAITAYTHKDADGKQVIDGIIEDVTERQRRHRRLLQSAAVFESTAEGVMVTDPDGIIETVNPAFTTITGYTEADVVGRDPRILQSGHHEASFYRGMWHSLQRYGQWEGEIWNRRKNGEVFPEWQTITEVRNEEGVLCNYVSVFADITKARKTEAELAFLTYHDPLTSLPNRALFRERLDHELISLDRRAGSLAVLHLDIDGFRPINDSLGSASGDAVLEEVAKRLRQAVGEVNTVSRPGSDEFWLLIEDLARGEDARRIAQKLLACLREPLTVSGRTLRLEASIGVALAPDDATDGDTLIARAATALHRAQEHQHHPIQFFHREIGDKAGRRLELEHELKRAIEQGELQVWYQPQIHLATGEMRSAEALVRWQHPERGIVSPGEFIPVAVEAGLMQPLGEQVLATAMRQLAEWRAQGLGLACVGINVATPQLHQEGLSRQTADLLTATGLPAECLELEITEESFLADLDQAQGVMGALGEQGVRLAIDDFGTGYSSLAYLQRLAVDTLKIDKTFVDGLTGSRSEPSIVEAILAVARQLDLEVVAEGVEEPDQAQWLREQAVPRAQGFLWARPHPPEAIEDLLGP